MVTHSVPRVLIGGTSSQVGKSLIVLGLLVALRKRGLSVSCCVTGDALHHALLYSRITRRYTRVLDRTALGHAELVAALYQASLGADVVIIDGRGGLYDGVSPGNELGSDAEIAAITGTPVVLVHKPLDFSNSIAAIAQGFAQFKGAPPIVGMIANRLSPIPDGDPFLPHPAVQMLNQVMDAYRAPRFLGGLPDSSISAQLPPSQVSQEENSTSLPMQLFIDVGNLVSNDVDIDALLRAGASAAPLTLSTKLPEPGNRKCRIAVTDDGCFNVCYQDNLDLLKYCGAELVPFSPLADSALPRKIGGLYVTGAYLKSYGEELSRNEGLRRSIKQFAAAGGVVYSEGAGTAFLCRSYQLTKGGPALPGVGIIPAGAFPVQQPRTAIKAETVDDSVLGFSGIALRGISPGDWAVGGLFTGSGSPIVNTMRIHLPGCEPSNEGYSASAQTCSTFHFLHFGSNPSVARSLVEAAEVAERTLAHAPEQ